MLPGTDVFGTGKPYHYCPNCGGVKYDEDQEVIAVETVKHSEAADHAIAALMNAMSDGSVTPISQAHVDLTNAINTYLLERGYKLADLGKLWNGEIQLTSS